MDEKEIAALAREYAEEMIKGRPSEELPNCLKNSMLKLNTEYVSEIFQWLTRRYCLVEKSKVKEEYKKACESVNKHSATTGCLFFVGNKQTIESLFPEIAKEVEE